MSVVRRFLRRRAIRSYVGRLPLVLSRIGRRRSYPPARVLEAVDRLHLNHKYIQYAYAIFCTEAAFNHWNQAQQRPCDYDALRAEVASICCLGDPDFSALDLIPVVGPHDPTVAPNEIDDSTAYAPGDDGD